MHWVRQQWELARRKCGPSRAVLILDEVHKIPAWADAVKALWDEDTHHGIDLRVVLLGSSPLLMQRGMGESLAGRFEVIPITHWSFGEMREAFGWDLDTWLYFGGYPGASSLVEDEARWRGYILESLIETALSRDILLMTRVDKPALLRRLFELGCGYSGRILSYQKMIGQLHDAGNTTTLAHYLDLLGGAGLLTGLQKFSNEPVRRRGSSPKLQVFTNALLTAQGRWSFVEHAQDPERRGVLVESAVGACLLAGARIHGFEVFYWLDRNREVDFVLRKGELVVAIEVKSGRRRDGFPAMKAFIDAFHPDRTLLVGTGGVPLEEFFLTPPDAWFDSAA